MDLDRTSSTQLALDSLHLLKLFPSQQPLKSFNSKSLPLQSPLKSERSMVPKYLSQSLHPLQFPMDLLTEPPTVGFLVQPIHGHLLIMEISLS